MGVFPLSNNSLDYLIAPQEQISFDQYLDKIPASSAKHKRYARAKFNEFTRDICNNRTGVGVISDLISLSRSQPDVFEQALKRLLQNWITYQEDKGIRGLSTVYSSLKKFFEYNGVDIPDKVSKKLVFRGDLKDELQQISKQDVDRLDSFYQYKPKRRVIIHLWNMGLRIGESLSIRPCDLVKVGSRYKLVIPAQNSKNKKGRHTFLSVFVSGLIDEINIEKYGSTEEFLRDSDSIYLADTIRQQLNRYLTKLGLDQRYENNGYHIMRPHGYRARFISIVAKKHGDNFAHIKTGHHSSKVYLADEYHAYTEDEEIEMFEQIEDKL